LRESADSLKEATITIERLDMDSMREYINDIGYFKHQCFVLCNFDWRRAKDLYEHATMDELIELIRGKYHYLNDKDDA